MQHIGFLAILPPVVAIALAIRTKQVFLSLLCGIWIGWVILSGNLLTGTLATVQALVDVFKDEGNTRTIIFSALVGGLLAMVQRSGGVEGFIQTTNRWLETLEQHKWGKAPVVVQLLAFITGILLFVESSISVLTVGALYRPVFDRLRISREKLAYLADSSSAPSCILIPLNAWGAYIMSLLAQQGFENSLSVLWSAFPYNLYPILAIVMALVIILSRKDLGPMRKAELRTRNEGKVLNDDAKPVVDTEVLMMAPLEGVTARSINMVLPIAVMVLMMPLMLFYTGWQAMEGQAALNSYRDIITIAGKGSGSSAVLYAVLAALLAGMLLYRAQGIMRLREMVDLILKGIGGLMPLALLMLLAFAIGQVCRELGTGLYLAEVATQWISPGLVPAILFLVSGAIAFSTGTSWGTFAIMISITVPMADALGTNLYLALGAALGGGIFGDHCSPISDTTILSSMAAATDHIDHVRTQLPYALIPGGIALAAYLLLGFM
jgi:tetracycline resistance efflux pump